MKTTDPLAPGEKQVITFLFAADLGVGDSIASMATTPDVPIITLASGTDTALAGLTMVGSPQITGTNVLIEFQAHVAGVGNNYYLTAQVNTALGLSISLGARLSVTPAALQ